jgi:hypothetical protein
MPAKSSFTRSHLFLPDPTKRKLLALNLKYLKRYPERKDDSSSGRIHLLKRSEHSVQAIKILIAEREIQKLFIDEISSNTFGKQPLHLRIAEYALKKTKSRKRALKLIESIEKKIPFAHSEGLFFSTEHIYKFPKIRNNKIENPNTYIYHLNHMSIDLIKIIKFQLEYAKREIEKQAQQNKK